MLVRNGGTNGGSEERMSKCLRKGKSEKGKAGRGQRTDQGPDKLAELAAGTGENRA